MMGAESPSPLSGSAGAAPRTGAATAILPLTAPPSAGARTEEPVLQFAGVSVFRRGQKRPVLDRIRFTVHRGEILGFAGVGGNGLGTLEALLGGFLHPSAGSILHRGRDISHLKTRALRREGLAYVPADRLSVGSAPGAGIEENFIINRLGAFSRRGIIDRKAVKSFSGGLISRYGIAGASALGTKPLSSLSGGNIQKLILAREIEQFRDYIVFSEPTWGLDIAASAYVYERINALKAAGAAVILISSNLDEIILNANRILVFYRGTVAAELANPLLGREDVSEGVSFKEEIGAYMMGIKHQEKEDSHG
jgi:simple sugar transport system ATP-binding protein